MRIPDGLSFDELNKLYAAEKAGDLRSLPFRQFFGEMNISQEQMRRRIRTAEDVKAFILLALEQMYLERQEGTYNYIDAAEEIRKNYQSMLDRMAITLTAFFTAMHVNSTATEIATATMNNEDDAYFFSEDRATLIAEMEANFIWNDFEFQDAIATGKRMKTWHTMRDRRVRKTHTEVEGVTIPIDEPFAVGDSFLMFPTDTSLGASPDEIVNCRCSVTYM